MDRDGHRFAQKLEYVERRLRDTGIGITVKREVVVDKFSKSVILS